MKTTSHVRNFGIALSSSEGEMAEFLVYESKKERDVEFKRLLKEGCYKCAYSLSYKPIHVMTKCHFNSTNYYPGG